MFQWLCNTATFRSLVQTKQKKSYIDEFIRKVAGLAEDERQSDKVLDKSCFRITVYKSCAVHSVFTEVQFLYRWSLENLSGFE